MWAMIVKEFRQLRRDRPTMAMLITLPIIEDTTSKDPKLALKCDKSMPMDSIPGSMLTNDQQKKALGK